MIIVLHTYCFHVIISFNNIIYCNQAPYPMCCLLDHRGQFQCQILGKSFAHFLLYSQPFPGLVIFLLETFFCWNKISFSFSKYSFSDRVADIFLVLSLWIFVKVSLLKIFYIREFIYLIGSPLKYVVFSLFYKVGYSKSEKQTEMPKDASHARMKAKT